MLNVVLIYLFISSNDVNHIYIYIYNLHTNYSKIICYILERIIIIYRLVYILIL